MLTDSKTIETTLGALIEAEPALRRLLAKPLPARVAYHLAKLGRMVREEVRHFEEQNQALIKELGAEREPTEAEKARNVPGPITEVKKENLPAFFERRAELLAVEVTLAWGPIALADLGAMEIAGEDLEALDVLIVDAAAAEPPK